MSPAPSRRPGPRQSRTGRPEPAGPGSASCLREAVGEGRKGQGPLPGGGGSGSSPAGWGRGGGGGRGRSGSEASRAPVRPGLSHGAERGSRREGWGVCVGGAGRDSGPRGRRGTSGAPGGNVGGSRPGRPPRRAARLISMGEGRWHVPRGPSWPGRDTKRLRRRRARPFTRRGGAGAGTGPCRRRAGSSAGAGGAGRPALLTLTLCDWSACKSRRPPGSAPTMRRCPARRAGTGAHGARGAHANAGSRRGARWGGPAASPGSQAPRGLSPLRLPVFPVFALFH